MNLIVTCARHLENEAEDELKNILNEFGDSEPKITITKMSGILTCQTNLEPIETVRKLRDMVLDEPWSIRYCLRVIPIQETVKTDISDIETKVVAMSDKVLPGETYRISIEKRNSDISGQEIISRIAKKIQNKVSLEFPDKIVLIETLENVTGISILKKSDVLSLEKTKRSMSE